MRNSLCRFIILPLVSITFIVDVYPQQIIGRYKPGMGSIREMLDQTLGLGKKVRREMFETRDQVVKQSFGVGQAAFNQALTDRDQVLNERKQLERMIREYTLKTRDQVLMQAVSLDDQILDYNNRMRMQVVDQSFGVGNRVLAQTSGMRRQVIGQSFGVGPAAFQQALRTRDELYRQLHETDDLIIEYTKKTRDDILNETFSVGNRAMAQSFDYRDQRLAASGLSLLKTNLRDVSYGKGNRNWETPLYYRDRLHDGLAGIVPWTQPVPSYTFNDRFGEPTFKRLFDRMNGQQSVHDQQRLSYMRNELRHHLKDRQYPSTRTVQAAQARAQSFNYTKENMLLAYNQSMNKYASYLAPQVTPTQEQPIQPAMTPAPTPTSPPVTPDNEAIIEILPQTDKPSTSTMDQPPISFTDILQQANQFFRERDYIFAAAAYQTAAEIQPENPVAMMGYTFALTAVADYDRAATQLRDTLKLHPAWLSSPPPVFTFYKDQGNYKEHLNQLRECMQDHQQEMDMQFLYAYMLWVQGNNRDAYKQLEKILLKNPDDEEAKGLLENLSMALENE